MREMQRVVKDLSLSETRERRGALRSVLYLIPIVAIVAFRYSDLYSGSTPPTPLNHEVLSMNMALNARFCGSVGRLSSRYSPYLFLARRPDLTSHSFGEVIAAEAGTVDAYCRTVTEPYVVAENSLLWLTRLALAANRALAPDDIGRWFGALRLGLLLVFGFVLIRTGASVLFTLASVLVGCAILRHADMRDTAYPFILPLPLLHAAAYGAAAPEDLATTPRRLWVFSLAMGALTAFSANLRTTFLPTGIAMFGVFLFAVHARRGTRHAAPRRLTSVAVAAVAFSLGFAAYVGVFVERLRVAGETGASDYAYHTLTHPLVLGLAVPESGFSQREGIRWDDMVGVELARRVTPGVELLGPGYEAALSRYYLQLWRTQPREMAKVYARKLRAAGSGVFLDAAGIVRQFGIAGGVAEWLDGVINGIALVALAGAAFATALWRSIRNDDRRMLMIAMVSLAALAALGEAFLIYSNFLVMYYSQLLFFVCVALLVVLQAGLDALVRRTPTSF